MRLPGDAAHPGDAKPQLDGEGVQVIVVQKLFTLKSHRVLSWGVVDEHAL